jgi:hypothetical protein
LLGETRMAKHGPTLCGFERNSRPYPAPSAHNLKFRRPPRSPKELGVASLAVLRVIPEPFSLEECLLTRRENKLDSTTNTLQIAVYKGHRIPRSMGAQPGFF